MTAPTKSDSVDTDLERLPERLPCLYLVLDALRPTDPPMRFPLAATDEVLFGRHDGGRYVERDGGRLEIGLDDVCVSGQHAVLRQERRGWWTIADNASKNGTIVNGKQIAKPIVLSDGDILELQHAYFVFRTGTDPGNDDAIIDGTGAPHRNLVTAIPLLRRAFDELALVAKSQLSILLCGETGTGKERVARTIHSLSECRGRFVPVNCGAIPSSLVESELFGSKRGAFSGAIDRPGLIRSAEGGTLFLDEIGDLPLSAQSALLRVLQEREVVAVGGTDAVNVDMRVVSASHASLGRMVDENRFRADLYQRLAGRRVELPPLRERREDVGIMIGSILRDVRDGAAVPSLRRSAARALLLYDWPGNIRELEQVLAAAVALSRGSRIELKHLSEEIRNNLFRRMDESGPGDERDEDRVLRADLERLLAEYKGNVTHVARALGTRRQQVQRWMKRFGLVPADIATRDGSDDDDADE